VCLHHTGGRGGGVLTINQKGERMTDFNENVVSIDALFDESGIGPNESLEIHPSELLEQADIIFLIDRMSSRESLVFGRIALQRIVDSDTAEELRGDRKISSRFGKQGLGW
jgi:hypothetical protein